MADDNRSGPADQASPALSPAGVKSLILDHFPSSNDDLRDIEILDCGGRHARIRLPFADRFARPGGTISGPTMFQLADLTSYVAIIGDLGEPAIDSVTTTLTINFLARPEPAELTCDVNILRLGRRQAVCEARIFSGRDAKLVAQASCIYALPRG